MDHNAAEQLRYERERAAKSFTQKHGLALAERMHRLCNVGGDEDLPAVHQQLAASSSKHRDYNIVGGLLIECTVAARRGLTVANAPLGTTSLVDNVFRSYTLASTGLSFGKGLTPFAIVCEGRQGIEDVKELIKRAEIAESESSVSLADAKLITTTDVRFPSSARAAEEQLYGWSILLDIFHGSE